MNLYIKKYDGYHKFYVDTSFKFLSKTPQGKESILLSNMSGVFDGICTDEDNLHFLIQSNKGELIYLKFSNDVWTKYIIFKNKDGECKISNITLTFSGDYICAFYSLEHGGKQMLIKHKFSSQDLYKTPEIIDTLDIKKEFSIFCDSSYQTHILYLDSTGKHQETTLDKNFIQVSKKRMFSDTKIFLCSTVYDEGKRHMVYSTTKKNYTVLVYKGEDCEEKIITFGIKKSTRPIIFSKNGNIDIFWREDSVYMHSASQDDGKTFSRPKQMRKNIRFEKIRLPSKNTGLNSGDISLYEDEVNFNIKKERRTDLADNKNNTLFIEKSGQEFTYMLSKIEKDVAKIGKDLDKICSFLSEITKKKSDIQKTDNKEKYIQNENIGEINEENLKLFESMNIDEVLPMPETETEMKI